LHRPPRVPPSWRLTGRWPGDTAIWVGRRGVSRRG
jgi:hypothetical protein